VRQAVACVLLAWSAVAFGIRTAGPRPRIVATGPHPRKKRVEIGQRPLDQRLPLSGRQRHDGTTLLLIGVPLEGADQVPARMIPARSTP
jgi:hypothetical protein